MKILLNLVTGFTRRVESRWFFTLTPTTVLGMYVYWSDISQFRTLGV